jgi:hypothetical protein
MNKRGEGNKQEDNEGNLEKIRTHAVSRGVAILGKKQKFKE